MCIKSDQKYGQCNRVSRGVAMSVAQGGSCHPFNKSCHSTSDLKEVYQSCVIPAEQILAHVVVTVGNLTKFTDNYE